VITSSLPPSASATPSRPRRWPQWVIATVVALACSGLLLLWLLGGRFIGWEVERLTGQGVVTIHQAQPLAESVRSYLFSDSGGLIQQHRLNNLERQHLLSVKGMVGQLKLVTLLLGFVSLVSLIQFRRELRTVLRNYAIVVCGMVSLSALLLSTFGFAQSFIWLHQRLFSHPDWIFPADSVLTALFPPQLFLHGLMAWLSLFVATAIVAVALRHFTSHGSTLQ